MKKIQLILFGILFVFFACKKNTDTAPATETGSVTDIDNNVYRTVKIGSQWWMAEDLKTRRYRDGSYLLMSQSDSAAWSSDTTGAYCDVKDNNQVIIGKLYNWYAVNNSKGLAPAGWHVATDADWKELEKHLGMSQSDADKTSWRGDHEGDKLKVASPAEWVQYGTIWSTNESGFGALPHGCRMFNGGWGQPGTGSTGFWWTISTYATGESWYRYLDYKSSGVFRSHALNTYGFSVRCVKD